MKFHFPKAWDLSGILANRTFLKIMLIKKDKMLLTNEEVAKEFNQYFGHINDSLDLYGSFYEKFWEELVHIDSIVCKFTNHQKIKEWCKFKGSFSSRLATTEEIKVIIRDLPTNKAAWGKSQSIYWRNLNHALINGKFPSILKYVNVTTVHKKDNPTDKTNFRQFSVLPLLSKILNWLFKTN